MNRFGLLVPLALVACSPTPDAIPAAQAAPLTADAPRGEIDFLVGYEQVQHGAVIRSGELAINYALDRLTTCRDTHNGFRFWTLDAWVRFSPGGQTDSATVVSSNGFTIMPATATFDVPPDATGVEIWFRNASPPSCEGWDSKYGENYRFPVIDLPPLVGWVGDWGSSIDRACVHQPGVPDPIVIDEYARERACLFVDADVWVPGAEDHAEWIAAQVALSKDGAGPTYSWLEPQGRVGNNQRFRFQLPYELRNVADWTTASYSFRFSTDGRTWFSGGGPFTIQRAFQLP
jgi:hypothetical protein